MLVSNPRGNYRFLQGGAAFSGAVIADPGYAIIHVTFLKPPPVTEGFDWIADYLIKQGRPAQAVCAIELRSPRRLSMSEFGEFNNGVYLPALKKHDLQMNGVGPMTRSNLAVEMNPPSQPVIYAFAYTVAATDRGTPRDFVLSGAADLDGARGIIRAGETSDDAMREKAVFVMAELKGRLDTLGLRWDDCTAFNVYTAHDIFSFMREVILGPLGRAQMQGVRWYLTRPPIEGLEFEADARRTLREVCIPS